MLKKLPDIVEKLREEEKLGLLYSQEQESYEDFQISEETSEETSDETTHVFENGLSGTEEAAVLGSIEEKYRTIFENYVVAITLVDEKERIVSWNKYAEELFNMSGRDLFMKPVSSLYPPEEWIKIRAENIRQKGMRYKLETKMIKKDQGIFGAEISLCVLRGIEGKPVGSVGIIRDISEHKKTERKLIESEEKYRTIFENSAVAIMLTDENENIISWNKYAEDLLCMGKDELFMKPVSMLYPEDEWKKIRSENVRQKGMQHHLETKIIKKNNELLDVDISISVLKDHEGNVIGSIGVIKDISEQKKFEESLAYERELLQSLLDNIPDSIYFKDKESRFIKVNEAKAEHSNVSPKDMIDKTDFDFLPKEQAEKIHEDDRKVMETGEPIVNKIEKITDAKGTEHWISVTKAPRYNKQGQIIGTMGISRDITQLRRSERKYKNLFETATDPIVVLDKKGHFVDINQQVTKLLGFSKEELIGKKFDKIGILSKDSISKTLESFGRRMIGEKRPPYEIEVITKEGETIHAEVNANPLYEDGEIVGDLVILRDLRERKKRIKVEKELIESEKKFRDIFDSTGDFLLYLDENGILLDINNTAVTMLELNKKELIGKPFSEIEGLFSKEDMKRHLMAINKAVHGVKVSDYESELVTKDGVKYKYLLLRLSTLPGKIQL